LKERIMIRPTNFTTISQDEYPTSDGRPMAETDLHRDLMAALIGTLKDWFAGEPDVYVSGNLLVYYQRNNKRVHVSPDVFVVRGVENRTRDNYLLWEEGKGLDVVIEITSKTTMIEDIEQKYNLYVSKLRVKEYFVFDPEEEYLKPAFQGYRRVKSQFQLIKPVAGRLPSKVLGLHLERDRTHLRLWDPETSERVPTPNERAGRAEAEAARLRQELDELRRRLGGGK
jgi:Uma2 family endonuclease